MNKSGLENKPITIKDRIISKCLKHLNHQLLQKMSRIQQQINNFDIDLTIYPEIKERILVLTGTNLDILTITNDNKPYLRELLHHLSVTYNTITVTNKDYTQFETSVTESE